MRGIIYAIDSASLKKTYIGSTGNMYMRRAYHRCAGNMGASRAVIDGGDAVFRIIEAGEFANLGALEAREAEYIRLYSGAYTLVNRKRYGRVVETRFVTINYQKQSSSCGRALGV